MSASGGTRASRKASWAALLVCAAVLVMCGQACGQTIGYLYSAVGGGIERFSVGSNTALTA